MRIVHLIFSFHVGGAETMLTDIANEQSVHADVHLVIINNVYSDSLLKSLDRKVRIHYINRPSSSRNPWFVFKLHHVLCKLKPDILHTHHHRISQMIPFRIAPMFTTVHAVQNNLSGTIRRYEKIIAISDAVKSDLLSTDPTLNITVIHNGILFSRIEQKKNYCGKPFKIVQIGLLDYLIKGQDITIRALRYVNDKLGEGFLSVDFIGEGRMRNALEALAGDLGVTQWVKFHGLLTRSQIYKDLQRYDLLIQPSRHEGFGLTIVEGMAAKLPVLVSGIDGPMEIIDRGRYGFSFPDGDVNTCGEKIMEIMELSRNNMIGKHVNDGYDFAKKHFDVRVTALKYMDEYQKVVICGSTSSMS